MARLKHATMRDETTNTAWGAIRFDSDGVAHDVPDEAHAALLDTSGFHDPDAPPAPRVLDGGDVSPTITHTDIIKLEAALEAAHRQLRLASADGHSQADAIARVTSEKAAMEAELARLRALEKTVQAGSTEPAAPGMKDAYDRLVHEHTQVKEELAAVREELHRFQTAGHPAQAAEDEEKVGDAEQPPVAAEAQKAPRTRTRR